MRPWVLLLVLLIPTHAERAKRESPAQMRRIIVQSLCLAIAYPGSELARDAEAVYALYAPWIDLPDPLAARGRVEALARAMAPDRPAPASGRNLGLAKCALFAERRDVLALLKMRR
jgi:hypothetical protein